MCRSLTWNFFTSISPRSAQQGIQLVTTINADVFGWLPLLVSQVLVLRAFVFWTHPLPSIRRRRRRRRFFSHIVQAQKNCSTKKFSFQLFFYISAIWKKPRPPVIKYGPTTARFIRWIELGLFRASTVRMGFLPWRISFFKAKTAMLCYMYTHIRGIAWYNLCCEFDATRFFNVLDCFPTEF